MLGGERCCLYIIGRKASSGMPRNGSSFKGCEGKEVMLLNDLIHVTMQVLNE
jgi:hypothetical protein